MREDVKAREEQLEKSKREAGKGERGGDEVEWRSIRKASSYSS